MMGSFDSFSRSVDRMSASTLEGMVADHSVACNHGCATKGVITGTRNIQDRLLTNDVKTVLFFIMDTLTLEVPSIPNFRTRDFLRS